ncbi:MAG: hypothetical protein LBR81_10005 [Prevotellaceae bacterium]|jgi:hypothetical protein|nr:hypothetical protein [Prevotellaceae bacterium]
MKKSVLKAILIASSLFFGSIAAHAEYPISFSGQIGYASPQGGFFKDAAGEKMSKFGLGLDFDVLYHLEQFDNRLGVGITYNTSILFGSDMDNADIGLYGLSLYGVKGHYRFFNSVISPYGALSLGLSQFSTPEVTMMDGGHETVVAESKSAFGFGIRPEIGVEFGAFVMSVGYTIPMKYKIEGVSETAGCWQINLGARINLFDRN